MSVESQIPDAIRASVHELPVLPTAVTRLLSITQQPDVSVGEIARVIESDPTLTAHGWLRTLILSLHQEIEQTEEAMGRSSGPSAATWKKKAAPPVVQLQIAHPAEQAVLMSMLLAMGFDPVVFSDASMFDGPARPVALVTDASPSDRQQQAYQQLDVAILDYAAFRQAHQIAAGHALDVCLLWTWLAAGTMADVPSSI